MPRVAFLVGLVLILAGCGDGLSSFSAEKLISSHLNDKDSVLCLSQIKIKKDNGSNVGSSHTLVGHSISESEFPIIFAEEAYLEWSPSDVAIMEYLISENLIAVRSGGYPGATKGPKSPGGLYLHHTPEHVQRIIELIKDEGAFIELTDKSRGAGIWIPDQGFCVRGFWKVDKIIGWTEPAPDQGVYVTNITAQLSFVPNQLGSKPISNKSRFKHSATEVFQAVKFNDGWQIR